MVVATITKLAAAMIASILVMPALSVDNQQGEIVGEAEIVDGDTITVNHVRIRLFGIDAPESDQSCFDDNGKQYSCGQLASVALNELIADNPVSCTPVDRDRYGRTVAICKSADGNDLSDDMVRLGFAVDYRHYSHGRYEVAEQEARAAHRGIWAGRFVDPGSWRHGSHTP